MPNFRTKLNRIANQQIQLAGPRYSPGVIGNAPNIEIEPLMLALDSLAFDERFVEQVKGLEKELTERLKYNSEAVRVFAKRRRKPETLLSAMVDLQDSSPATARVFLSNVRRLTRAITKRLEARQTELSAQIDAIKDEEKTRPLQSALSDIRRLLQPLRMVDDFLAAEPCRLLVENRLLILGDWGTGKTHFLCDMTRRRIRRQKTTLFVLAQHLPTGVEPLQAICQLTGLESTPAKLLRRLDRAGKAEGARALIIIDGINEGDREAWRASLLKISSEAKRYQNVGFVLSCRRPFNEQMVSAKASAQWVAIEHPGFGSVEFDAQVEFFQFYNIPAPQVPLLTEEFSRPLFLKILCETIRELSQRGKKEYLKSLASGQKGMTKALEDFVRHIGAKIEKDLGLAGGTCWRLLKGDVVGGQLVGITLTMANTVLDYVTRGEALAAIGAVTGRTTVGDAEAVLHRMLTDGLLMETSRWSHQAQLSIAGISLPYQRFSDHLIARHLLKTLKTGSEVAIRRSFYRNRPLGKVFELTLGGHNFVMPGIASAIMLEFPERVKNQLPPDERELVFLLPKNRRLVNPVRQAFLSGLHWRAVESFTKQTNHLIDLFLSGSDEYRRREVLEILVELATRPGHPASAQRLMKFLAGMKMPDRDLMWSEYLRSVDDQSIVLRLMRWIERTAERRVDQATAESLVVLLSLFLTTTRKNLRDRATRSLTIVGMHQPKALFDQVKRSFAFNDPYVPERVLASAYGIAMNGWADPKHRAVQAALPDLCRWLVEKMFAQGAPHATRHTLMRDYALGLVELGRRVDPTCVNPSQQKWLRPPFDHLPEGFPIPASIDDADAEKFKPALRMDFENYTIGHLVSDRQNYDANHPGYKDVRKQILWRAGQLGYSAERFDNIDRAIAQAASFTRSQEPERVERYGKKYTWIGYFEMYGLQQDRDNLPGWRAGGRCPDVDIDPSFPIAPRKWQPAVPKIFSNAPMDLVQWIKSGPTPNYARLYQPRSVDGVRGAWVLLDGYIQQGAADKREIFTFLRGAFVKKTNVAKLRRTLEAEEYPGNFAIPEPGKDYYTFAGEIPWSAAFAPDIRSKKGVASRALDSAFRKYVGGKWRGISIELGVRQFLWEGHHSTMNSSSGATVLAPRLAETFSLVNHDHSWDLFSRNGKQATIYVQWRESSEFHSSNLFYVRRSLLRKYLKKTGQDLVMIPWGERTVHYDILNKREPQFSEVLQKHYHIHKGFYVADL
jgi:DNA replication protein DnaC